MYRSQCILVQEYYYYIEWLRLHFEGHPSDRILRLQQLNKHNVHRFSAFPFTGPSLGLRDCICQSVTGSGVAKLIFGSGTKLTVDSSK